ncbi:MAG: ABC transporter ATP-binding protein [Pseudomonadales bacterium]
MTTALEISDLHFSWPGQSEAALTIDALSLAQGQSLFIQGPSGSGKSTLLNLIAGMLTPQRGSIYLLPQLSGQRSLDDRFRADHIGYIFQQFNLLPFLSALENVSLSCQFSKLRSERCRSEYGSVESAARHWLTQLNIPERLFALSASQLSVGQQQRVAAARAMMGSPELIIADEPTSALDVDNARHFVQQLLEHCQSAQSSLLFVSHDLQLTEGFDHRLTLQDTAQVQL